jgi:hypothetical protein
MNPTIFWVLFLTPALFLVFWRVARQGRGNRISYLRRLAFRAALSVLVYELYSTAVWKVWRLSAVNDFDSTERMVRGFLFWLLFYWSIGSFDRETWGAR